MKDMAKKRRSTWGEKHHAAVFTAELILEIRSRVAAGKRGIIAEIAREYNVTPTCIEKIAKRQRWKDI